MPLPGKLCVGILEEDNPLKSFFRFKPLLVMGEDDYAPFGAQEAYPEEGCLRIVPDKNESSRFKARMRRIGRYALLDLRAHAGENDKIRPNKNYMVDPQERNAHIVYSDVVVEPPAGMLFEVLALAAPADSAQMALTMALPGTARVLLHAEGALSPQLWRAENMEEVEGGISLIREPISVDLEGAREVRMPGFSEMELRFVLAAPGKSLLPAETAAPEPPPAPAPAPEAVAAFAPRSGPRIQARLNQARGRSLQEIIDDKWRRSRIDQLGHPVPAEAMGTPIESPIEHAIAAMQRAWQIEDLRAHLMEELAALDGFGEAFRQCPTIGDAEHARQLSELEAQRLRLLDEIDALAARRADLRAQLLAEIRRDHARELAEGEQALVQLRRQVDLLTLRAEDARAAAAEAEESFEAVERNLLRRMLEGRASRFLNRAPLPLSHEQLYEPTFGELMTDVRTHLSMHGHNLSHDDAVNLLTCIAISPATVLCGSPLSPKEEIPRLVAGALGLAAHGRFAEAGDAHLEALLQDADCPAPALILLADCNAPGCCERALAALLRIEGRETPARLLLTARDGGQPLPAELVDRAFLLRLAPEGAKSPWALEPCACKEPDRAISRAALSRIFAPEAIDPEALRRMEALRRALAEYGVLLSRRALTATAAYCAAATPKFRDKGPIEALDLALAQRALPSVLSCAPVEALRALPELLKGLPCCLKLLEEPLPLEI